MNYELFQYPSAGNIRMQLVVPRAVSAAEMAATIIRRITSHVDLLSFIVFLIFLNISIFFEQLPFALFFQNSRFE